MLCHLAQPTLGRQKGFPVAVAGDEDFDGIEGGEDEQGQFGGAERLVRLHRRRAEEEEQEEATIAHERTKELVKRFVDEGAMEGSGDGDGTLAKEMRSGYLKRREVSKWDAETVLSLRSNLDNHPGTLDAPRRGKIRLSSKTGLPVGYVGAEGRERKLEEVAEGEEEGEEEEERVMVEARKKGETKEERKARKQAVKEAQREARQRKKGLKTAFTEAKKEESKRQAVGGHGVSAMRL